MKIYSIDEARKIMKTSKNVVAELVRRKMLESLKLKSIKIPEYAIEEFFRKYKGMDLSDLDNIKEMRNLNAIKIEKVERINTLSSYERKRLEDKITKLEKELDIYKNKLEKIKLEVL